jgi:CHAD domain-containing protein
MRHRSGALSSKIERQVKLSIGSYFRLPPLPGHPIPRHRRTLTYYDSSQFDLAQAGITLRHRTQFGKQAWQLKLPLIHDRQEIEIIDPQPHPPRIFCDLLFLHLGNRQLLPVVILQVWRTGIHVCMDHIPVADITVDSVSVVKDGSVIQRFREIEIKTIDGKNRILSDLEQQLRRAGAEDHDGRPKLFRALSLPAPGPEPPPALNAPVIDHVKWVLGRHVRWLLAHDPGTRLGREPESLHQVRVATRRLHAVLRAAKPLLIPEWTDSLQDELRWLGQILGPTRDLDVQLAYFRGESATLDVRDRRPLTEFTDHLEAQRNNVREVLLNELKGARYLDLIRRLQQAKEDLIGIESTITVHELAKDAFRTLRRAVQRLEPSPKDAGLHEIRIKTKRARYAAELAEPIVGKTATRFIKKACAVQDLLGRHQDAIQAEAFIRAFLKQSKSMRAAFVAGRMVERQRDERKKIREEIPALLKGLMKRGEKAWR